MFNACMFHINFSKIGFYSTSTIPLRVFNMSQDRGHIKKTVNFQHSSVIGWFLQTFTCSKSDKNTRKRCKICSKLTIKQHSCVILNDILVSFLLTLNILQPFSSLSIDGFQQVFASWVTIKDIGYRPVLLQHAFQ